MSIGLHEPFFRGNEKKYLLDCIKTNWVSTSGKYLNLFEKKIKKITGSKYVIPVLNGTIGLHISLITLGVKNGDEVIVPSITFIASVNSINYVGAQPIFMDVDKYLNLDEKKCIEFLQKHTFMKKNICHNKKTKKAIKAIVIVHAFGNAAKFNDLQQLCKIKNIKIIEDAAESLGTKYISKKFKNKHTGTIGELGVISFNGNKIVTSGNGGAVLTQDKKLYEKCKYLVYQAKDDKINFIHNEVGYNYSLSNISAALGLAQLEMLNSNLNKKKKINRFYSDSLKIKGANILQGPKYSKNNKWLNLLVLDHPLSKKIMSIFYSKTIQFRPIWYPNHLQKKYLHCQKFKIHYANKIFKKIICIPSGPNLRNSQLKKICNFLKKALND